MAEDVNEGGKKNKLVLIGGLVVGLAIVAALAVGGTLFFLDRSPSEESAGTTLPGTSGRIQLNTAFYYTFEQPFVAPLVSSDRRQRFLQVSLAVKAENQAAANAIEKHMPLIKNNLNMLFTRQDYQTLQTPEGKLQLQLSAAEVVQGVVEREGVRISEVLITDFVMQ
ncbi:flagellar basal body-associated FliL family protein [Marinospirillum alkaliphilum]|uniref:Flagellar protein FliL n=1 Tax=Marinospirillum alkaliphilum DSM 21637 TaxID=1122209 RepID=A0A1K1VAT5_9GAMM|nr:flagellar basal body-associated FliL family protein [Marinospirillum alkaliphilum]SFX22278.1 flagellar FliL protein [Marinospirillum alkaliphilum DSM 21637]